MYFCLLPWSFHNLSRATVKPQERLHQLKMSHNKCQMLLSNRTHRHMPDWQRYLTLGRAPKHALDMYSYRAPAVLHTTLAKTVIVSQPIQGKAGFELTSEGLLWVFMWTPAHPDVALFIPTLQMVRAIHSLSCVMKGRKERGFLTCLNIIQNKEIAQKPGMHLNKLKLPAKSHICYTSFHFILRAIPLQNMEAPVVWCPDVPRHTLCTASCFFPDVTP